jgi:hypothetical protein
MTTYYENIAKLRARVSDAVRKGLVDLNGKQFLEATLIQIMNDAEKNRQNCLTQAENLRRQANTFEGQAGAFASISSIVFNVINGFVAVAERDEEERAAQAAEKAEAAAETISELVEQPDSIVIEDKPVKRASKKKTV